MNEKQIIKVLSVSLIIVLGLLIFRVWNRSDHFSQPSTPTQNNETLQLGVNIPPGTALHAAAERFAQKVFEKSAGTLQISVHPNQDLGNDNQMVEMTRNGELAMVLTPTAKLSASIPAMQILDLPFFFPSREILYKALDGEFGKKLLLKLQNIDLIGVTFWENGFKQFTANQPLYTPEAFKGLKFRIMKSPLIQKQFESMGAKTVPIDFHATKKALIDGVVDGQENPLVAIVAMGFHEVQTHLTLSNHAYLGYAFSLSKKRMNTLSAENQKLLIDTAQEITQWEREETQKRNQEFLKIIQQAKVTIHELTENERKAFQTTLNHMPEEFEAMIGVDIVSSAQEIIIQETRKTQQSHPILIGLDADLSMHSELAGLAIKQGAQLAIHEINASGGVLGRQLVLIARDHQNNGRRGRENITLFASMDELIAIIGGKRSSVIENELNLINELHIPYLIPWASAAALTQNNDTPNYIFRVSLNDQESSKFLVDTALKHPGKLAIVFEKTLWGESNHVTIRKYLDQLNAPLADALSFNVSQTAFQTVVHQLNAIQAQNLIFIGNSIDGELFLTQLFKLMPQIKVTTHWGILGNQKPEKKRELFAEKNVVFPQTVFLSPPTTERTIQIMQQYKEHFKADGTYLMEVGAGFAHTYDLVHMLALAIKQAQRLDRVAVREALENLPPYDGVVKHYTVPFTKERHDALSLADYHLGRFQHSIGVTPVIIKTQFKPNENMH